MNSKDSIVIELLSCAVTMFKPQAMEDQSITLNLLSIFYTSAHVKIIGLLLPCRKEMTIVSQRDVTRSVIIMST